MINTCKKTQNFSELWITRTTIWSVPGLPAPLWGSCPLSEPYWAAGGHQFMTLGLVLVIAGHCRLPGRGWLALRSIQQVRQQRKTPLRRSGLSETPHHKCSFCIQRNHESSEIFSHLDFVVRTLWSLTNCLDLWRHNRDFLFEKWRESG